MGLYKKEKRTNTYFVPLNHEPLKKFKVNKKEGNYKNLVEKFYLESFLKKQFGKNKSFKTKLKAHKDNILSANTLYEKHWFRHKLPYSLQESMQEFKITKESIKNQVGIRDEIKRYFLGFDNPLAKEYFLSLQTSYDFITKRFRVGEYIFLYLGNSLCKCVNLSGELGGNRFYKDSVFKLSKIGIYLDINEKLSEYDERLDRAYKEAYSSPFIDKIDSFLNFIRKEGDKAIFELGKFYKQESGDSYRVSIEIELNEKLFEVYKVLQFENSYFVEYKKELFWGKNYLALSKSSQTKKERFVSTLPLVKEGLSEAIKKHLQRAYEVNQYTRKNKRKRSRKDKGESLLEQVKKMDKLKEAHISQYVNLFIFFYKEARANKECHRYLKRVCQWIEKRVEARDSFNSSPAICIKIGSNFLGFQLIKRVVRKDEEDELCYFKKESGNLFLHLNTKKDSESYIKYSLNIGLLFTHLYNYGNKWDNSTTKEYFYRLKVSELVDDVNRKREGGYSLIDKVAREYGYEGNVFRMANDGGHGERGRSGNSDNDSYDDRSEEEKQRDRLKELETPKVFDYEARLDFDMARYLEVMLKPLVSFEKINGKIQKNESNEAKIVKSLTITHTMGKYDTLNGGSAFMQSFLDPFYYNIENFLMPVKLWIRVPYKAQLHVFPSTIFMHLSIEYIKKKAKFVFAAVLVVAAVVSAYFGNAYLSSFFLSLLYVYTGEGIFAILAFASSLYATASESMANGGSSPIDFSKIDPVKLANFTLQMGSKIYIHSLDNKTLEMQNAYKDEMEGIRKESAEYEKELGSYLNLEQFNIVSDFTKSLDTTYEVSYGNALYDYDSFYTNYYDSFDMYERFKG